MVHGLCLVHFQLPHSRWRLRVPFEHGATSVAYIVGRAPVLDNLLLHATSTCRYYCQTESCEAG